MMAIMAFEHGILKSTVEHHQELKCMSHEYELKHRAPPSAPPQTANPNKRERTRGGKGRREKREKKLLAQAEALATANPSPSNL